MFEHILIPLDFTEKNDPAIAMAEQVATPGQSRMSLLHVIEAIAGVDHQEMTDFYEMLESRARTALGRLQTDLANREIDAEYAIAFGKRPEEIVCYAEESGVDLIIMSSRRLDRESRRHPWPTISHHVAVFSPCPVLLVR